MKATALRLLALSLLCTLFGGVLASSTTADEVLEPSPIARMAHGLNPANWQMPKWKMPQMRSLLPGNDEKARIKKKKDGFFDEVSKTASNSWSKTKAAFSPDNFTPMRMFPASTRTPAKADTEPKRGFFQSLFSPWPEEPEPKQTPNQWLGQPRP